MYELDPFAGSIGLLDRQAGHVAARSRQTFDQASADRVSHNCGYDRDDRSRLLHRDGIVGPCRDDDVDPEPDELGRDLGDALGSSFRPAMLDRDGAPLDPTKIT